MTSKTKEKSLDAIEQKSSEKLLARLRELKVKGKILAMARQGQLHEIICEMPNCYCPRGKRDFVERDAPMDDWALNADHYPQLKKDGGKLTPGNIRLAHVMCNRTDYEWRTQIRKMLDSGMSLYAIAEKLNKKKIAVPHGRNTWTAAMVRKAYVS